MVEFNDSLTRLGCDLARVRLLRHDTRGLVAWRRGGETAFGCWASFQKKAPSPCSGPMDLACHFLPGPTVGDGAATRLFVGATRILDRWDWDRLRRPRILEDVILASEAGRAALEAFDLEWPGAARRYSERLLINWGAGTRSWSQWAGRQRKEILELRLEAQVPPFPGFAAFRAWIGEIAGFPQAWVAALGSVRGVHLLVSDDGEQYVGSASGADGFIGRWHAYAANGHGGNFLLRQRGHRDGAVSGLEVASPDMAAADILARETFWKGKLGARAHGLNAN